MPKNILNLRLSSKDISIAALNNSKEWIGFLKIIFSKITFTKKVFTRSCAQRASISVCHVTIILISNWSFSYNTEPRLACIHVTSYQSPYKRALPGAKYQKFKIRKIWKLSKIKNEKNVRHCVPWSEKWLFPLLVAIQQNLRARADCQDYPKTGIEFVV